MPRWLSGWRGGRASDLRSSSRGFEARPRRCCVTTLGKLFTHTLLPPSPSSIIWYQRKLGSKQAYRVVHQPVSRSFADAWLSGWLAEISADLRENGSALEVVLHDYALYKSTFTLLYFTLQSFLSVLQKSPSVLGRHVLYMKTSLCLCPNSIRSAQKPASKPGLRPGFRQVADISVPKLIADKSYTTRRDRQCKGVRCPPIFSLSNLTDAGWP